MFLLTYSLLTTTVNSVEHFVIFYIWRYACVCMCACSPKFLIVGQTAGPIRMKLGTWTHLDQEIFLQVKGKVKVKLQKA